VKVARPVRRAGRGNPPGREAGRAPWSDPYTYVATWSGMVFTAFVTDVFSRRIVGWRTAPSMPTELPLDALEMALWTRARAGQDVDGVVHHSDAGAQYTSIRYATRLLEAGALASIGTVADSYDNAMAESVVGLYKTECTRFEGPWRGVDDLELATLSWVHWFNLNRFSLGVPKVWCDVAYGDTRSLSASDPLGVWCTWWIVASRCSDLWKDERATVSGVSALGGSVLDGAG